MIGTNPPSKGFHFLPLPGISIGNRSQLLHLLGFKPNNITFSCKARRQTYSPDFVEYFPPWRSRVCRISHRRRNREKRKMTTETNEIEIQDAPLGRGKCVLDADMAQAGVSPAHLVVMVNGLVGSAVDWKFAAEQFVQRIPDKVLVHCSECNYGKLTFDGVDLMGERLVDEVLSVVERTPGLRKISFVAHSLGGLVARYAIGKLYKHPGRTKSETGGSNCLTSGHIGEKNMTRIAGLEPVNFITLATPHLGSRGHKQLPFLCGLLFLEKQVSQTAHLVAGRSGKHLFLTDNDDGKPPLLLQMATDSFDYKFMSALRSFKRRVAYSNANYDSLVGWETSSIRRPHELPKVNLLEENDKYPHVIYIEPERIEASHCQTSSDAHNENIDFEEEMIRGLRQVPWERVDVSFHRSRQKYVAHNTIQVKSYWLNSDGVGVISHMIDHFVV